MFRLLHDQSRAEWPTRRLGDSARVRNVDVGASVETSHLTGIEIQAPDVFTATQLLVVVKAGIEAGQLVIDVRAHRAYADAIEDFRADRLGHAIPQAVPQHHRSLEEGYLKFSSLEAFHVAVHEFQDLIVPPRAPKPR